MKKLLLVLSLTIIFVAICAFSVNAEEAKASSVYYLVQDAESDVAVSLAAEGKNVVAVADLYSKAGAKDAFFNQFNDNDSVELILAENICYHPSEAENSDSSSIYICVEKALNVTVRFSGFYWWIDLDKLYAGWRINNSGAYLNFIGEKGTDESGKPVVTTASNYSISTPSSDLDFFGGYVGVLLIKGSLNVENLRAVGTEEIFYQRTASGGGNYVHKFKGCSMDILSSSCSAISLKGQGGCTKDIQIENCRLSSVLVHNLFDNSYIKDTVLFRDSGDAFFQDSWRNREVGYILFENVTLNGTYYSNGDGVTLRAINCKFAKIHLQGDSSGGASAELTDSTCSSVDYGNNKKDGKYTVITSASCSKEGSVVVNSKDGVVSTEVIAKLPHLIEERTGVSYTNYFENGYYTGACALCNNDSAEENALAKPLFVSRGFSYSLYNSANGYSMTQSFKVNNDMLAYLDDATFGVIAAVNLTSDPVVPTGKTIVGELTDKCESGYFEVKISGISNENKAINVIFCAYITLGEKIYYLDNGATYEKLVGNSYDAVVEIGEEK